MKILFILENFYPNIGGVETLFRHLTLELAKKEHQIFVLTTKANNKAIDTPLSNYKIIRLPFSNRYLFTFFSWIYSIPIVFWHKIDFIHTTSYNAGLPALITGLITNRKVIITFHEVWGSLWYNLPYISKIQAIAFYYFEKLLLNLPFYRFVAVSQFTANALHQHRISKSKIVTIYNGIDLKEFAKSTHFNKPASSKDFQFLYFGRTGVSKGLDLLLPAFKFLSENYDGNYLLTLKLILPQQSNKILDWIKQFQKQHSHLTIILVHGLTFQELQSAICSTDAVVIPSYSEGFCFAGAEASQLNVPIIHSGRGALPEVISTSQITFEYLTCHSLARAMKHALNNNWQLPLTNHKHNLQDCISHYIHLYQNIQN